MAQNPEPWKGWIPGVLSSDQIGELCKGEFISEVRDPAKEIDYSALDLCLDNEGYHMSVGSIKPCGSHYADMLKDQRLAKKVNPSAKDEKGLSIFNLESNNTYVFKLRAKFNFLQALQEAPIYGQATAKSSVGRVDVLARLIVDGMDEYESFTPEKLVKGNGKMYLEITPITFNVRVKEGSPLSQLRLFYGKPEDSVIESRPLFRDCLLHSADNTISVDLTNTDISNVKVAAFCAKKSSVGLPSGDYIDLWKHEDKAKRNDPCKYWTFRESEGDKVVIKKDDFYILRSKERIILPGGIAVYCRAMDEAIGEMRIHYAGFVHPYFGKDRQDSLLGTPLAFEVRGHNVNVLLSDGEKMAKLTFYRMSKDPTPNPPEDSSDDYSGQTLRLSNFFRKWPDKLRVNPENGSIESA